MRFGMAHRIHACRDRAIHPYRNGDGRYVGSGIDDVTHDIPPRRFRAVRERNKKRTITLVWKRLKPGGERLAQPTNTFPPCNPTVPWPVRQRKAANFAFNPTQPLRTRNTDKTPHRPIGSRPIAKNIRESSRPLTAGMKIGDRPCFPAPFLETLAIILLSILDYFPARANDYDLGFFGNPVELHRAWIDVVRRRLARGGLEGLASKR